MESEDLFDRLFSPQDKGHKINISVLSELASSSDYKQLIGLLGILFRVFQSAGRSLNGLIDLKKCSSNDKQTSPKKTSRQEMDVVIDDLNLGQLTAIIKCFHQIRTKLKDTVYSLKIKLFNQLFQRKYAQFLNNQQSQKIISPLLAETFQDYQIKKEQIAKYIISQNISSTEGSHQIFGPKVQQILKSPKAGLGGRFSNQATLYDFLSEEICLFLQQRILSIGIHSHQERENQLLKTLKFINDHFLSAYQVEVHISKNTLVETRIFINKLHKEFLLRNQRALLKNVRKIINEALLSPSNIHIQQQLFKLLKRIYILLEGSPSISQHHIEKIEESQTIYSQSLIRLPLFLNMRSISLYSQVEEETRDCAMLCYKIVSDRNDMKLANLIQTSDQMRFIRNSKFYSSKAYAFSDQNSKVLDISELSSQFWKYSKNIGARQFWCYNIIIQKSSSLVYWQFSLQNYDIRWGLFRVEELKQTSLQNYEKEQNCKEIVRFEKMSGSNGISKGHLFLKNGFYRFVFDNTYSMVRGKDLAYSILHLESSIL